MKKMRTTDLQDVIALLNSVKEQDAPVLIVTHERPDGDAVGSASALWYLLTENGFRAKLYFQDELPDAYRTFVPEEGLCTPDENGVLQVNSFSMILSADASTPKRIGMNGIDPATIQIPFAAVDHHPDHIDFAKLTFIDPTASSAAEIVFELAKTANWIISADAATRLYLGVTTDTGCFRFDNTTPRALRTAADLKELSADSHRVIDRAYFSKPFNMARFEAELFCRALRTAEEGRVAWFMITNEMLARFNVNIRNTENLIENLRQIEGVTVAALIKPTSNPGIFKVSLRSKDDNVSVGKVARRLNGGGHELAAGCTIFAKSPENAEEILLKHIGMELKK